MPARKKAATKKKATKKKQVARASQKKKGAKKPSAKKTAAACGARTAPRKKAPSRPAAIKKTINVEPGPPPGNIPPVEEPTVQEIAVGVVTHYYSHLGVAVVQVNTGSLRSGDTIRVRGHTTDFTQQLASMEYEHQHVAQANPGQSVGIRVADHAREHDIVFVVK